MSSAARRWAGESGTHSLASLIVSLVFFMVSFVIISLVVIISLQTVAMLVVNGMHSMWVAYAPHEQRRWHTH